MNYTNRLFFLIAACLISTYSKADHGPNGYHIASNHGKWGSFYSTTIAGAATANSDGSGVMLLCNVDTNNCHMRLDLLGFCTHNGTLPITISIDGKPSHNVDFSCMGSPVKNLPEINQSVLISNFNTDLHAKMQKGNEIEFFAVDQKGSKVTMRASLTGYTAATNAMIDIFSSVINSRSKNDYLGQFID